MSKQKDLNTNDKYYILNRISNKYKDSGVNLAPLNRELEAINKPAVSSVRPPAAKQTKTTPAAEAIGRVEKILITETPGESRVLVMTSGVERSNYFLMKDADPEKPAKIVVDFYGAKSTVSDIGRDISPNEGMFANVTTEQFDDEPPYIVRTTAELRENTPYRVKREDNFWIISAEKQSPDEIIEVTVSTASEQVAVSTVTASAADSVKAVYQIEIGDVLGIIIYPAEELSREVIVQPDGNISFPLIGSLQAKGLTVKALETEMSERLGQFISNPQVTVTIKQFSRRQVFITGEVKAVGAYPYKENQRLMEFISSIGGFSSNANRREVKVYRGPPTKRQIHTVNVEEIVSTGDFSKDFLLEPGDIIEVQKGSPKIALLGDVGHPGYYDHRPGIKLLELVSIAGGFTDTASLKKVSIIRKTEGNEQKVMKVNLKKILQGKQNDVELQPGDTIFVPKKSIASAGWFISNILPWLTLISLILVIRGGI
ncbi:MAG: polysaccharide export protein [Endomicrobiales bacterium]|nr:polysaccharide export protein [Endomicrobiales bacterium]